MHKSYLFVFLFSTCVNIRAVLMLDENGEAIQPRATCAGNTADSIASRRYQSVSVLQCQRYFVLSSHVKWAAMTYAEPPWAFPNMADFLPRLVKS